MFALILCIVWEQKRNSEYLLAFREVFLLLTSILLLQVHAFIGFHGFCIFVYHAETSQLISNNNWLTGFCVAYGSQENISFSGNIN